MSLFKVQITIVFDNDEEIDDSFTVECEFEDVENKVFEEFLQEKEVKYVIVKSFIDENGNEYC